MVLSIVGKKVILTPGSWFLGSIFPNSAGVFFQIFTTFQYFSRFPEYCSEFFGVYFQIFSTFKIFTPKFSEELFLGLWYFS